MTLAAELNKVQYNGDDSTVVFAVTFDYWADTDIKVIHRDSSGVETDWVDGTHYSLSGGSGSTGTLTVDVSPTDYTPATGESITIKGDRDDLQGSALPAGGRFATTTLEKTLDQMVRLIQQKAEQISRAPKFSETSTYSDITFPDPVEGKGIKFESGALVVTDGDMETLSTQTDIIIPVIAPKTSLAIEVDAAMVTIPWTRTLSGVHAEVGTAGITGVTTIDIHKNGVTMLSTKITIDTTTTGSDEAAIPAVISVDSVAENDVITVEIDGVSSGTAPKGLTVRLKFT